MMTDHIVGSVDDAARRLTNGGVSWHTQSPSPPAVRHSLRLVRPKQRRLAHSRGLRADSRAFRGGGAPRRPRDKNAMRRRSPDGGRPCSTPPTQMATCGWDGRSRPKELPARRATHRRRTHAGGGPLQGRAAGGIPAGPKVPRGRTGQHWRPAGGGTCGTVSRGPAARRSPSVQVPLGVRSQVALRFAWFAHVRHVT
jgi:hypothetical protein